MQDQMWLVRDAINLISIYFYNDDPRGNGLLILYSGKIKSGIVKINREVEEICFFLPAAIQSLSLAGGSHNIAIHEWVKKNQKAGRQ